MDWSIFLCVFLYCIIGLLTVSQSLDLLLGRNCFEKWLLAFVLVLASPAIAIANIIEVMFDDDGGRFI